MMKKHVYVQCQECLVCFDPTRFASVEHTTRCGNKAKFIVGSEHTHVGNWPIFTV